MKLCRPVIAVIRPELCCRRIDPDMLKERTGRAEFAINEKAPPVLQQQTDDFLILGSAASPSAVDDQGLWRSQSVRTAKKLEYAF